jgi:hypothetical protein
MPEIAVFGRDRVPEARRLIETPPPTTKQKAN